MAEKLELTPEQALAHAVRHIREGTPHEAERIVDMVLGLLPRHAGAFNIQGVIALNAGQVDQAIQSFAKSAEYDPTVAGVWVNLAMAHLRRQQVQEAVEYLNCALEIDWNQEVVWGHLVQCYIRLSDFESAVSFAEEIHQRYPDNVTGLWIRYRLAVQLGRFALAISILKDIKAAVPDKKMELDLELCSLFITSGFPGRARQTLQRIIADEPDNPRALWLYGEMLQLSGLTEKALPYFLKVQSLHELDPTNALTLASLYLDLGDEQSALTLARKLLVKEPTMTQAYVVAAQAQESGLSAPQQARLKALNEQLANNLSVQSDYHYAMAITQGAQKNYKESFSHYKESNRTYNLILKRQGRKYHQGNAEKRNQAMTDFFTQGVIDRFSRYGIESKLPIFIVGMPRSGTTLTERILGAHSRVAGVGELMDLPHLAILMQELSADKKEFPECLNSLNESHLTKLAEAYVNRLADWESNADMVVNKLPGNYNYLGLIRILFPNAPIIHCVRDPRDTLISCFFARFGPGLSFSNDLSDLAHQYGLYRDLMDHWEGLFPDAIYNSFYGDLVTEPEKAITQMLRFCGLEWEYNCLEFHKDNKAVRTASRQQVRKPIYTSSLERWRRYEGLIDEIQHLELPDTFKR